MSSKPRSPESQSPKPPQKLKARLPRGLVDRAAGDLAATNRMLAAIRETYELYGFEGVETPLIEYTDALGKFLPDQDRPNEGVFSFQDDDGQWLSLRYDLTAPLARHVAENFDALPKPYRSYRAGWVFRNEKPGPGRFRQFMQFDADTVGAAGPAADAEMCMMLADTLERVGIRRGDYVVKVNNRKILDGVMEAIGIGGAEQAGTRLAVLRAIDKQDRLGTDGVLQLLGEGRKDESGDFTKGAGLTREQQTGFVLFLTYQASQVVPVIEADGTHTHRVQTVILNQNGTTEYHDVSNARTLEVMRQALPSHVLVQEGLEDLTRIADLVESVGYGDRVLIDPSVVRGLEYYTGPVYEAELTFPVANEDGQVVRFGSVAGGGRYDGLVGRFRGEATPATGFSIGVSRLFSALQLVRSPLVAGGDALPLVVVTAMDRDAIAGYQRLVAQLRQARHEGRPVCRAELYLGSGKFGAQMKYADRRGATAVVIQGSDERARGVVQVKDLVEGARAAAAIATNAEWKAARPAQVEVPEAALVETIREILARHAPDPSPA